MKKFALLFLSIIALGANAQSIHLIPKVGLDHSFMTDIDNTKLKLGYNIGLGTEFMIGPIFALEPGVYYTTQGFKAKSPGGVDIQLKNNYLNIPVYAKVYLFKGINIFAGPQVSFRLNTKASVSSGQTFLGENIKKITNNADLSAVVGAGYQSSSGFLFSANYNIGALDVFKDKVTIDGNPIKVKDLVSPKNRVIQFNVGWRF